MSPTARTLKKLREDGAIAQVTEKWNPYAKIRQDLFGIIDILAIVLNGSGAGRLLAIQATSGSNHSARIEKALSSETLRPYLRTGNLFQVWSWAKKGSPRKTWQLRISEITYKNNQLKVTDICQESKS